MRGHGRTVSFFRTSQASLYFRPCPTRRGRPACPLAPTLVHEHIGAVLLGDETVAILGRTTLRCQLPRRRRRWPDSEERFGRRASVAKQFRISPWAPPIRAPRKTRRPRGPTSAYVRAQLTSRWRWSQARTGLRTPKSNGRSRGPNADFWPMSRSPYVRTLKAGTSFEEGRRMGLSADAHSIFRRAVDPRRVFCAGCAHSEFIHSDDGSRRCLYSECKCSAWRGPGERDDPITTILPAEVDDGGVDIAEGIDAPGKLVVKKIQAVEGIT